MTRELKRTLHVSYVHTSLAPCWLTTEEKNGKRTTITRGRVPKEEPEIKKYKGKVSSLSYALVWGVRRYISLANSLAQPQNQVNWPRPHPRTPRVME